MTLRLWALARLYRADAALLSSGSYLSGALLAGRSWGASLATALGIGLISNNFVYTLNAWTDREIDRVNRPERPLPAGAVSPAMALGYALALLALALVYPWLLADSVVERAWLLTLPALGISYSVRPLRLKRIPSAALVVTSLLYWLPLVLGTGAASGEHAGFLATAALVPLSLVPLKDLGDEAGDALHGCGNWSTLFGLRRLLAWTCTGLVSLAALAAWAPMPAAGRAFLLGTAGCCLGVLAAFHAFGWHRRHLYPTLLGTVAASGFVLVCSLAWKSLPA